MKSNKRIYEWYIIETLIHECIRALYFLFYYKGITPIFP